VHERARRDYQQGKLFNTCALRHIESNMFQQSCSPETPEQKPFQIMLYSIR
jgi:hypothetical protein